MRMRRSSGLLIQSILIFRMDLNNNISIVPNVQKNYKVSTEDGISIACIVASSVFIPLFFVVGVPGNINVLKVLRRHQHIFNQVTKWTLVHLAIFDLISCLVNFPILLVVAIDVISNDEAVHILQIVSICLTNATVWKNCACLILLALARCDATIRAFLSQIITIQRLKKCLCVTWFVYLCIICSAVYVFLEVPYTFALPRTITRIIAKQIYPSIPIMLVLLSVTIIYVLKSYFNIKNFLRTQADNMETYITIYQANARRENERKLCRVMLQMAIVLAVTALPPAILPIFHKKVSVDVCIITRILTLLSQVTNPFIYSTISEDFLRFLPCFKFKCFERNHSVNAVENIPLEDVPPHGSAPSRPNLPMRLDINALEEDTSNSETNNNSDTIAGRDRQTGAHSVNAEQILDNEPARSMDSDAPSTRHARGFIPSGHWRSLRGQDLSIVDI